MYNYTKLAESEAEFLDIGPIEDLPIGERLFIDVGDRPIVIFNIAGELFAIADVCSHDDGPVGEGRSGRLQHNVSAPRRPIRRQERPGPPDARGR